MILIPFGLIFALIGVGNLVTGRLHPERPNARLSRGLGYIGIVVGLLSFVFGLLQVSGVLVVPGPPVPATTPDNDPRSAPSLKSSEETRP